MMMVLPTTAGDLLITNARIRSSGKWDSNRIIIICTFTWRVAEISESTLRKMPFLYPTQPYPAKAMEYPLRRRQARKKERCKRQPGHMMSMKKTMTSQVPREEREQPDSRKRKMCTYVVVEYHQHHHPSIYPRGTTTTI